MKNLTIDWLNKCRCGNKSHSVKTARGNNAALWDDDAVKCNSCGRGGVIQVCEGQARVLWETDEEMAEVKPMSTITKKFTKEQVVAQVRAKLDRHSKSTWPVSMASQAQMEKQILEIALASLEAKPVAAAYVINGVIEADDFASYCGHPKFQDWPIELYAAPHATVSVPDFGALTKCIVQRLVDYGAADDDAIASAEEFVYNACRAAMLQGAEHVTTGYKLPDGWVACSERMPEQFVEVLACTEDAADT